LDTLKLTDIKPKRTWSDVHEDFYREPPANPGKILLLYSPDSRPFKELQVAFRSFLELACHCVVLDLFDEELLAAIAYDPEAWIDQLLRDDRFKVIVVCSQVNTIDMFHHEEAFLANKTYTRPRYKLKCTQLWYKQKIMYTQKMQTKSSYYVALTPHCTGTNKKYFIRPAPRPRYKQKMLTKSFPFVPGYILCDFGHLP
jgi:hypothetical protein